MDLFRHQDKTRPLFWFVIALAVFLAAGTALLVSQQRLQLLEQARMHADRELHLLGAVITHNLIQHDYAGVRDSLASFGAQYEDISRVKVTAPNGFVVAEYRRPDLIKHFLVRSYCVDIEPPSMKCVDIELVYDLDPIHRHISEITRHAVSVAVLFAGLMGLILWKILRQTAFLPLERSVADLHSMKEELEVRVAQRTADWMLANKELKQEILERETAEKQLLESEAKFKTIAEQAIVGIYLISEGRIKYCNPRFAEMFGYESPAALQNMDYRNLVYVDDFPPVTKRREQRLSGSIPSSRYQFRGLRRNGEVIHVEVFGTTVEVGAGFAAIGTILDVTDRVHAQAALEASEAMHRMVLENISEIIYLVSLPDGGAIPGLVTFVSGQVAEIVGRPADDFLGDPQLWIDLICPEDLPAVREATERLVRERTSVTRVYRVLNRTRQENVWIEDRIVPQLDDNDAVIGYFGVARDITRRKQAEDALKDALAQAQEEKNKSDAIIAAIGDGISIQNTDYTVLYQNAHHKQLAGDHVGAFCFNAYEGLDSVCPGCPVERAFADGKVHTVERSANRMGETVYVEITASPLRDSSGTIIAGIEVARNITERKRMEEEREAMIRDLRVLIDTISTARREWQETFDSIRDMISIHGEDYTIIRANRAFSQNFGLEPRDVIGRKCFELFHGGSAPVFHCPHQRTLDRQEPITQEISDPASGRIYLISTYPLFSAASRNRRIIHIARDITEVKEKEMRLIMSERLASLGQMASGIAHEINNPLAAIAGCVDGLNRRIKRGEYDPELFQRYLGIVKEEIGRSKNITTSMLSIVRKSSYEKREINVIETLEKALEIIGFQGRLKQVEVRRRFVDQLPSVFGSEGELKQVFLNVMANALDAMGDRGTLTLATKIDAGRLVIDITDTGPGVAPELRKRIFDPFFTTKTERGGTGLGLSIANRIMTAHDGTIEALATEECGATVRMTLPVTASGPSEKLQGLS